MESRGPRGPRKPTSLLHTALPIARSGKNPASEGLIRGPRRVFASH